MKNPAVGRGDPFQLPGNTEGHDNPSDILDPASSQLPEIADPRCRDAARDAITAMRRAADIGPHPEYGILLALRNGGEAIEPFNDRAAEDLLADTAIDLIEWLERQLAIDIIHRGGLIVAHARWEAKREATVTEFPEDRAYRIPKNIIRKMNELDDAGDTPGLKEFVWKHPPRVVEAMKRYLYAKRRRDP